MDYFGVWHFVPPVETDNYLEAVNMKNSGHLTW